MNTLLIHSASLISFHDSFEKDNDAIFVEDNKIKAVGSYDALKPLINESTKIIDGSSKTLMPGFNDTHIHIWKVGNLKTYMLDVRGVQSKDELLSMLSDYNHKYPEVAWINARGFNEAAWKENIIPTKEDLDKVSTSKPIYVIRTCAHIAVANSKALELSGITKNTLVPHGGEMRIGYDGNPNGIFTETALALITNHIPPPTKDELKKMVMSAREEMYSYGITAATDPAVDPILLEAYYEMNDAQQLGFRLNALPIVLPDGGNKPYPIPQYFSSDFFNVNTVKFFSDGGLSGKTASLKRTYKNTNEKGVLRLDKEQYTSLCTDAIKNNLGIATHAIGDAAIDFVIDVYKELNEINSSLIKRIEHLGLPSQKNLEDMCLNNIATSMQTIFIDELGKNFSAYLDDEYLSHCYPVRSVLKNNILTALSSDAPVVKNFNPLKGAAAAILRKTSEDVFIAPSESISIGEALKAYTIDAARISNLSNYGALKEGMIADFILLDKNPLQTNTEELASINVKKTFVDGECVWEK